MTQWLPGGNKLTSGPAIEVQLKDGFNMVQQVGRDIRAFDVSSEAKINSSVKSLVSLW